MLRRAGWQQGRRGDQGTERIARLLGPAAARRFPTAVLSGEGRDNQPGTEPTPPASSPPYVVCKPDGIRARHLQGTGVMEEDPCTP